MFNRTLFAFVISLFFLTGSALALKRLVNVQPGSQATIGFSVATAEREAGVIHFTVTRDLARAPSFPAESELTVRRSATLEIYGESGLAARCSVASRRVDETCVYDFVIARAYAARSYFQVSEIDDYKDERRERLIGGGTYYRFKLGAYLTD